MTTETHGATKSNSRGSWPNPLMTASEGLQTYVALFAQQWAAGGLPGASLIFFLLGVMFLLLGVSLKILRTQTLPSVGLLSRSGLLLGDWLKTLLSENGV